MFAQRTEGFPSGGKKTASSLSRKRLMRGDKSPPAQGIHSLRAPPTNRVRSRTLQIPRTSRQIPKTSLYGNRRPKSAESLFTPTRRLPCREVRGDEGGLEGERQFCNAKSAGSGFAALDTPPKGGPSPSKVFSSPPHHSKQTAEADGDSAHVGNFVDFDLRVNATRGLQNGANLVGRYRVNTATERD